MTSRMLGGLVLRRFDSSSFTVPAIIKNPICISRPVDESPWMLHERHEFKNSSAFRFHYDTIYSMDTPMKVLFSRYCCVLDKTEKVKFVTGGNLR